MSVRNRALTWALRRWIKPQSVERQDLEKSRAMVGRVPFGVMRMPGWRLRASQKAPARGEWTEPVAADHPARQRCILYCHGGAYVAMSPRTHRAVTSRLAVWSDASVFSLDYRLAPEHPFPAALEDSVAAYRNLRQAGIAASHIVVAGDSAGGGLALATLLALRDAGDAMPAGAVLFSPWTDLAATGPSLLANSEADALLYSDWVASEARYYLQDADPADPLASPLYGDMTGLPPLFIQVGDSEILLDDLRRLFDKAKAAGIEVTLQIWRGVPHGWQVFAPILPEGRNSIRAASAFIRARMTAPGRIPSPVPAVQG